MHNEEKGKCRENVQRNFLNGQYIRWYHFLQGNYWGLISWDFLMKIKQSIEKT